MSTKDSGGDSLENLVEKAKQASLSGKLERAAELYLQAIAFDSPKLPIEDRFHVQRAWVNSGILSWREGNPDRATECWHRAIDIAQNFPDHSRIQAAGLRAERYLLLNCEAQAQESERVRLVERWIGSRWPEVHVQLLDLCLEKNERCGFSEDDPNAVWLSRYLFGNPVSSSPPPSFFSSYDAMSYQLKRLLASRWPHFSAWFEKQRLPQGIWTPYSFESSQKVEISETSLTSVRAKDAGNGIRSIHSLGKLGWTWCTREGQIVFQTEEATKEFANERTTLAQWNAFTQQWAWVEDDRRTSVKTVGLEFQVESLEVSQRVSCLVPIPDGWFVVTQGALAVRWNKGDDVQNVEIPSSLWIFGLYDDQGRILLASERGDLGIGEPRGVFSSISAHRGRILAVASDPKYLYSGGEDGVLRQWEKGKTEWKLRFEHSLEAPVFSIISTRTSLWACGGKTLMAGNKNTEKWTQRTLGSEIQALGVDDSDRIVWSDKKFLVHWGDRIQRTHSNWVMSIAWNPFRRTWLTADLDSMVCEWSEKGDWKASYGFEPAVEIRAHADCVLFRSSGWITVRTWKGEIVCRIHFDGEPILSWSVDPTSRYVYVGSVEGSLGVFDLQRQTWVHRERLEDPPAYLHRERNRLRVVTHNGSYFEFPSGEEKIWKPGEELNWGKGTVAGVRWSLQGVALIWGPSSKTVYLFDPEGRKLTAALDGVHRKPLSDGFWEEDGSRVWTAGRDGKLVVWETSSAEVEQIVQESDEEIEQLVALRRVVVVRLNSKNWALVHRGKTQVWQDVPGHRGKMTSIAVPSDQDLVLSSGEDAQLRCFSLPDGEFLRKFSDRIGPFKEMAVHPTQNVFFAVGKRGEIVLGSFTKRSVRTETPQ